MTGRCVGQPVSWLVLEQFCLGELDEPERRDVATHLEACEACAACRDDIEKTASVELPALPPLPVPPPRVSWLGALRGWRAAWAGLATAAVAAAAFVAFVVIDRDPSRGVPGRVAHVKGGEVAIDLVRESGGSTAADPGVFRPADRFKVVFTCPPDAELHVDVLVHQDDEPAFPLAARRVTCANRVVLPGAFRITGDGPAHVCALYGDHARSRDTLGQTALDELDDAVCYPVTPAAR